MVRRFRLPLLLLPLLGFLVPAVAQPVTHAPDPAADLPDRWAWAQSEGVQSAGDFWIGYGITKLMRPRSWMGSWSSDGPDGPTLSMLIYGEEREPLPRSWSNDDRGDDYSDVRVERELALLFRMRDGNLTDVRFSNIGLEAPLYDLPLYWLGRARDAVSVQFLVDRFDRADDDLRSELVAAVALHERPDRVLPFLEDVLTGTFDEELRADAAFWIGQHGGEAALPILQRAVAEDPSGEVREKAVFAISRIDTEDATEALIRLARDDRDREVRERAIFWLGQKASEAATAALTDMVFDEDDTDLQKQAVFALSQQDDEDSLPLLVEIGKTHANPEVRKQAIFWIGQIDDPRAVDALVEFLEGR